MAKAGVWGEIGRILDSAPLRAALTDAPDACLVVAVSNAVFHDVVRPEAYNSIRADQFRRVWLEEKTSRTSGRPAPSNTVTSA